MYLAVLGAALIVSVVAMSAMMVQRLQRSSLLRDEDIAQARLYAHAALKMAMLRIENDPDWRYNRPNGVWEADTPIGDGTYTIQAVDPTDNDLADAPDEPLVVTGIGKRGAAVQKAQLTLAPARRGLSCLETALHAGGSASLTGVVLECDQTLSADGQITASGATVNCDVEAAVGVSGATYNGRVQTGVDPRDEPDPLAVFDYYKTHGVWIDIDDIVAPSPTPPPANLLSNPGFETGVAPWTPWRGDWCALAQVTGPTKVGSYALKVASRYNYQSGPIQDISPFVQSGVTYFCGGWVRMTGAAANARWVIDVTSSGEGAQWWLSANVYCRRNQWTYVSGEITPTFSGAVSSATLKIETDAGDPVNDFYLDDALMMVAPRKPPGPNLLAKGDMESDPLSEWYAVGCDALTSTIEHSGAQAIRAINRDSTADTLAQDVTDALQNGAAYYAEAWVRQSNEWTNFRLMLKLVSTGDGARTVPLTPPVYAPAYTYVRAYGETVVSWTGELTQAEFYVENDRNAVDPVRLDDAVLVMSQPPPLPPHTIYRQVLSPNVNPFGEGSTSPEGIYVIDCQGEDLHIERSRIVGTLVLLNAGPGSSIREGPISWSAAKANFPALLVEGHFQIGPTDFGLNESYEDTNFNPAGTGYPGLGEDADKADILPSRIEGLVYVTGDVAMVQRPVLDGVAAAGGGLDVKAGRLVVSYQPAFLQNPPPGFSAPEQIRIVLGSVRRATD